MKQPTQRFSDRVENYVKYRPTYPTTVLRLFQDKCGLTRESAAADVGSGTGILSRLLLETGCTVFGVEPNEDMRKAAEDLLRGESRFISIDGTAEHTTLQAESVDFIAAAQAFHWFDRPQASAEFRRIARPDASAAILWNTRLAKETAFLRAYEELLIRYAPEYSVVDHRNVSTEEIKAFYLPSRFQYASFPNSQRFDFEGLKGRLLSSSYAPNVNEPNHLSMMAELRRLFDEHEESGKVEFLYRTDVYYGSIRGQGQY
ncbi:MAG TPA: class I SAM-dependent methyltransferase [Acidobacteriota bacterium]|nr:class I SAM-dependent methyltransferase [Acidobacteriota bacterium]